MKDNKNELRSFSPKYIKLFLFLCKSNSASKRSSKTTNSVITNNHEMPNT